jgi:hypothetical protein
VEVTRSRLVAALVFAACVIGHSAPAAAEEPGQWRWTGVERVVAVGDVHGAFDELVAVLADTGLIDGELRWVGGETHLVMLGDIADRGPRPRECFDLMIRLQHEAAEAGGRLHFLLGNHEVMNLMGDLRYVTDQDFASYVGREDQAERKREIRRQMRLAAANNSDPRKLRSQIGVSLPEGYFARRQAFSPTGIYGRWLLEQEVLVVIDDVVFVHAGLPRSLLELDPDEINTVVMGELTDFLRAEFQLIESGALGPDSSWTHHLVRVRSLAEQKGPARDVAAAQTMLALIDGWAFREDGPLWYRGTALNPVEDEAVVIIEVLDHLDASTVVIGHTPTHTGLISTRFEGAVIEADTGMLTDDFGGRPSALELRGDLLFERYPSRPPTPLAAQQWELTAGMFADNAEIERFLATAPVVFIGELGSGSTRPMMIALADDGRRSRAIFKTVAAGETIPTEGADVLCEASFLHEVAAYRIDLLLGLGMVPPTVLRTIDGVDGSLQLYVEGAVNEVNRRHENLEPDDPRAFDWQLDRVRAFDWLILNPDRPDDNILYTADWQVHLIDHARAFAPAALDAPGIPTRRPRMDEDLAARIDDLDPEELRTLLVDLLEEAELEALLTRVEKAQRR